MPHIERSQVINSESKNNHPSLCDVTLGAGDLKNDLLLTGTVAFKVAVTKCDGKPASVTLGRKDFVSVSREKRESVTKT